MLDVKFPPNLRGIIVDEKMRPKLEQTVANYLFMDARQKANLSIDKLAQKVWPDQTVESSRMKIHRFLKPQINGKPKNMYLFDFLRYCEALDLDPVRALTEILIEVEKTASE